jgi:NADP-dependent 3-hydroxy acid dehydrogenase YdfG
MTAGLLTGRRVVVTGASSGLGEAIGRAIVEAGGRIAMLARGKDRLDALAGDLGPNATAIACDVTDLARVDEAIAEAARTLDGIDAVITVAGRAMVGTVATGNAERWRQLMELNLLGPLATVRAAVAHLDGSGRRDILLIGSAAALTPAAGLAVYSATKRGLRAAFDALRLELAPDGINVSHVMPGIFDTEGLMMPEVVDGEVPPFDAPMFADGSGPAAPKDLAHVVVMMLGLPDGVCINEAVVRPTGQLIP